MARKTKRDQAAVFCESVRMETETVFHENGPLRTFPCAYELGQQITSSGGTVKMKAKVVVDADGNTSVMPYQRDSGRRYRRLMTTAHGELKETNMDLIVKFQFHKSYGAYRICDMLEEEVSEMMGFLGLQWAIDN